MTALCQALQTRFPAATVAEDPAQGATLQVNTDNLLATMKALRDESGFLFNQLMDVCGIDYLQFGVDEWVKQDASSQGFSRGVNQALSACTDAVASVSVRFAVIYHLLSTDINQRLRVRVGLAMPHLKVPSVTGVWAAANWFEREAFDLFGFYFEGHPDCRRILTDYGFIGHPLRKDFPLNGEVEMRYDAASGGCVYEPVSIQPRVLVPKVIRQDRTQATSLNVGASDV